MGRGVPRPAVGLGPYRYLWIDTPTQGVREGGRVVNATAVIATAANTGGCRDIGSHDPEDREGDSLSHRVVFSQKDLRPLASVVSRVWSWVMPASIHRRISAAVVTFRCSAVSCMWSRTVTGRCTGKVVVASASVGSSCSAVPVVVLVVMVSGSFLAECAYLGWFVLWCGWFDVDSGGETCQVEHFVGHG